MSNCVPEEDILHLLPLHLQQEVQESFLLPILNKLPLLTMFQYQKPIDPQIRKEMNCFLKDLIIKMKSITLSHGDFVLMYNQYYNQLHIIVSGSISVYDPKHHDPNVNK